MKRVFSKQMTKIVLIFGILCLFINNPIFAKITSYDNATNNDVIDVVTTIVQEILDVAMNYGMMSLSVIISALALVLWLVLQILFVGYDVTDNMLQIPFPDTIIFNKMALFDANFINPDTASPLYSIKSVVSGIYQSFVIIATASFVIIAMVIGIKLALSTIASEKAQYKKAVSAWVTGMALLLSLKWIIAGLFLINETIVQKIYDLSTSGGWEFEVISLASIPLVGSTISEIMSWFGGNASTVSFGAVPGYLGMVLKYMLEGIGGNFMGSLIAFVVMGQTVSIIISYIKRVFYCVLLGIVGPLIIMVDTFNRSMGKNTQVFGNWLKQISLTIMMQSFHAVFMYVIIKMIIEIGANMTNQAMSGLIIITLTAGLIKFEKLFKQLFGMSDAVAGDLKGSSDKAFAKAASSITAAKAIADNGKKLSQNKVRRDGLLSRRSALLDKLPQTSGESSSSKPVTNSNVTNNTSTNTQTNTNANTDNSTGARTSTGGGEDVKSILIDIRNQMAQKTQADTEKELREIETELGDVEGKISSAYLAKLLGPANALAGLAIGIGSDNAIIGGTVTTALDAAAEKVGTMGADQKRRELYSEARADGRDNPSIMRNGGKAVAGQVIKQEVTNMITLKQLRDVKNILTGKFDSSPKNDPVRDVEDIE